VALATDAGTDSPAAAYRRAVGRLEADFAALPPGAAVRLAKKTSNLFRPRRASSGPGLDVAAFDGVISVDRAARTADVGAMTTYEHLVDALLPYGLMPLVVPELKTITIGGAITGLGIESSSWRNGMPHESMLELDVLTGAGTVVTATPDGEHRDLFYGFPNSYGTLGYALRVRIELEEVAPFVHVRHLRFTSLPALIETLEAVCAAGVHDGEAVAFVDGTVFAPGEAYLTLGAWAADPPEVHSYSGRDIYYRSVQTRAEDWLSVRDYLWRWDTDWFWCSRAFGVQRPGIRRFLGPRVLRSDTYWRILALEDRWHVKATLDRARGRPPLEPVVQDIEVPVGHLAEFLTGFFREIPISPFWLCPVRLRDPAARWELYPFDPDQLYVNVGFWSACPIRPGTDAHHHNRWVEDEVDRLGGRKSLYSTSFYDRDRFWTLYNGPVYRELKARYDPSDRLLDLYEKCVQAR
jgi:FAD/FMN-containing dehydrogenase